jgi:hypothetical protein
VKEGGGFVMVWAAISWCSVGPITTLHGWITASEYVDRLDNQVHPMIQMLFLKKTVQFCKQTMLPCTIKSRFEEHEGEIQHLSWPAQSSDLNIIESLRHFWSLEWGTDSHLHHL